MMSGADELAEIAAWVRGETTPPLNPTCGVVGDGVDGRRDARLREGPRLLPAGLGLGDRDGGAGHGRVAGQRLLDSLVELDAPDGRGLGDGGDGGREQEKRSRKRGRDDFSKDAGPEKSSRPLFRRPTHAPLQSRWSHPRNGSSICAPAQPCGWRRTAPE